MSETAPAASLKSAYARSSCSSAAGVAAGCCASAAPGPHSAAATTQRARGRPRSTLGRRTLDDLAALDDDCDVLQRVNVGQRVGVDGDQVGVAARRDGADVAGAVERLGRAARGGLN